MQMLHLTATVNTTTFNIGISNFDWRSKFPTGFDRPLPTGYVGRHTRKLCMARGMDCGTDWSLVHQASRQGATGCRHGTVRHSDRNTDRRSPSAEASRPQGSSQPQCWASRWLCKLVDVPSFGPDDRGNTVRLVVYGNLDQTLRLKFRTWEEQGGELQVCRRGSCRGWSSE